MKKSLLTSITCLCFAFAQAQTAVNFTATDCASTSHNLFAELDAGKVVVITWPMPCGACISAASTAENTVTNMANPNVVFYLVDDVGNTTCATLNSWASTNSIAPTASFSNAGNIIKMTDYGTSGMPKTVVLGGGTCHGVFFNVNGNISASALTTAINNALAPCSTGMTEQSNSPMGLSAFPNPAATSTIINYSLAISADVTIEVTNLLGETVRVVSLGKQSSGKQLYEMNLETLSVGSYFIKLNAGEMSETMKVTVTR